MITLIDLLRELDGDRLDAWKKISTDKSKQRKEKSMGQPCGRGWTGLRGACERSTKKMSAEEKDQLSRKSRAELAKKIRQSKEAKAKKAIAPAPAKRNSAGRSRANSSVFPDRKNFVNQANSRFARMAESAKTPAIKAKLKEAMALLDSVEDKWLAERSHLPFYSRSGSADLLSELVGSPATW
jgi:hypothetical protein